MPNPYRVTMLYVTPGNLKEALKRVLIAGLVPNITSSPGLGKSNIVTQLAKETNLKVLDIRLSQCDQTDLLGYPTITPSDRSDYALPAMFPLASDPIPGNYAGWILFLDEFNSAAPSVQAAAYKLILDKAVGLHKLHPNVAIITAGNLEDDNAYVNPLNTALQSRLIQIRLEANLKDWVNMAQKQNFDHRVVSFIQFRPDLLHKFDPDHTDLTFPCPRTWEFVSKLCKNKDKLDDIDHVLLAGTVGEGASYEFIAYIKVCNDLPTVAQIKNDTGTLKIPTGLSVLFAITGLISANITSRNITQFKNYIDRLPIEYQILVFRAALKKDPTLINTPYLDSWMSTNAASLDTE